MDCAIDEVPEMDLELNTFVAIEDFLLKEIYKDVTEENFD